MKMQAFRMVVHRSDLTKELQLLRATVLRPQDPQITAPERRMVLSHISILLCLHDHPLIK